MIAATLHCSCDVIDGESSLCFFWGAGIEAKILDPVWHQNAMYMHLNFYSCHQIL